MLFVDDDASMHDAYAALLRLAGFSVACCRTGTATAAALRWRPDMTVVHMWLDDTEGFSAVRAMKTEPGTCRTPIVAFTARSGESLARQAGCDFALLKPAEPGPFIAAVRDAYHSKRLAGADSAGDGRGRLVGARRRSRARRVHGPPGETRCVRTGRS